MHGYSFNIGDLLKLGGSDVTSISSPANPDKQYSDSLRVEFRFWDGRDNVYVVTAEDGITMLLLEKDAALQEAAEEPAPMKGGEYIDIDLYQKLLKLGIIPNEVRRTNVGASDYSQHVIQPWAIWQEYNLNPWDADIVKRVLRHKATDTSKMDYEKIIHDCQERIRQLETDIRSNMI